MFFKRKKLNDYLNDEQYLKELEVLRKNHQEDLAKKAIPETPVEKNQLEAEFVNPVIAEMQLEPLEQIPDTKPTPKTDQIIAIEKTKTELIPEIVIHPSENIEPEKSVPDASSIAQESIPNFHSTEIDLDLIAAINSIETSTNNQTSNFISDDVFPEILPDKTISRGDLPEIIIPQSKFTINKHDEATKVENNDRQIRTSISSPQILTLEQIFHLPQPPEIKPEQKPVVEEVVQFTSPKPIEITPVASTETSEIAVKQETPKTPEIEKTQEVYSADKSSFFGRLKNSLSKTKNNIVGKISWIMSSKTTIDDDVLEELEEALYTSDIGVKTTELIMKNIRQSVKDQRYKETSQLKTIIKNEISALIKSDNGLANADFKDFPHVVLVVGVNGNGKTTTIGKLAHYYKKMGKKVIVGAADTFRAAAIEQLEAWAERAGCEVVKQQMGADPAAVAYNAYEAAISRKADILLIDTAGRLHTKVNLMNELEKISRVIKKFNPNAPHDVLLVLDATTGQNALSQARLFTESTGITGLVLTKLDGTAKGGVAIAINHELEIPVKFIGIGEKIDDLSVFDINEFVNAIFD